MAQWFKYIGASDDQVRYRGNDDPRGILTEGQVYKAVEVDMGDCHTNIYLEGHESLSFNSACFEEVDCPRCSAIDSRLNVDELRCILRNTVEFWPDDAYKAAEAIIAHLTPPRKEDS